MMLYEEGTYVPPIVITEDGQLVDGRHRLKAQEELGAETVKCTITEPKGKLELIAQAFRANYTGGPMQPSQEDFEITVQQLLGAGAKRGEIIRLLAPLPKGLATKFIKNVQSKVQKARLREAVVAVTDGGMTVPQSADKFGVDKNSLKNALGGSRKKKGLTTKEQIKARLTASFRSDSAKHAHLARNVINLFEEGELSESEGAEILAHFAHLVKQMGDRVKDWQKRFETTVTSLKNDEA